METLGVLLAGGRGARLGLRVPKALACVGGETLLARAQRTLERVCDEIVVVAPAALDLPVGRARRVNDSRGFAGPLAGVVAGLASRPFARALVLGVDFPMLRASALAALLQRLGRVAHANAVLPAPGGVPQPLAAAYAPVAAAALAASLAAGERSITAAVMALGPELLDDQALEALEGGTSNFFNLNTPGDLAEAERRLREA